MIEMTTNIPVIALRGTTILPGMIVHFDVSRSRSVKAVEAAMLNDQKVLLVTQRNIDVENPDLMDLHQIGTIAYIKQVVKLPKDLIRVLVEGISRAELVGLVQKDPYLVGSSEEIEEEGASDYAPAAVEAMKRTLKELFRRYAQESNKMSREIVSQIQEINDLDHLMETVAINLPLTWETRQKLLDTTTLEEKFELLGAIMNNEVNVIAITKDLQRKIKSRIDKNQREYMLREQLKIIREELGEDNTMDEAEEFRQKLKELDAPEEVRKKLSKEIEKFKTLNNNAPESHISRTYIETLLSLPWNHKSEDSENLKKAWKVLESGHYGLKDVKERIMEFLSVRKLTHKGKSPILCLVGPPGTGKTSIAQSVAEAMNKKYVRISLGGVKDEAEIRGHRKTYVGAMPGRITVALQQAGVSNPLMLLDEVDKTSSNYKGDTASALLEVLDPEQNSHFTDHYVEVAQDLSEVLFIATANDIQGIPRPLLDRMELIEIAGYTENEKVHIAKEHLIPKQMRLNGIEKGQLTIQSTALTKIINNYTKESGVRTLDRTIGRICRKTARAIIEDNVSKVTVTAKNLPDYLGRPKYNYLMANKKDEVGIARGLAWTQVGGDTLEIEVNTMPGKGKVILTGQLGDVMKESASAGVTYIRSISKEYEIPENYFEEHDIHLHIPEGAVPKDGPSAGITMATAILSAVTGVPIRADLAMTGEITLRGRVLAIGGLKEKLLAAKYAHIKEVLVPKENQPNIEELDAEILDGLTITFVETMEDVLAKALSR
ncbi:MAG: endopeptidase La [Eubacteriales bacterium]|nr:endopeptidase La [Eubacteriales bacterium]